MLGPGGGQEQDVSLLIKVGELLQLVQMNGVQC